MSLRSKLQWCVLVLGCAALSANAQTNLHVSCGTGGATASTCISGSGNVNNWQELPSGTTKFEVGIGGSFQGSGTGTFYLLALVPDNEIPTSAAALGSIQGTFGATPIKETATQVGLWENPGNPDLGSVFPETVSNPKEPLGAYLPDVGDPSLTLKTNPNPGFEVYDYNFGTQTLGVGTFMLSGNFPKGTIFTYDLYQSTTTTTKHGKVTTTVNGFGTPPSEQLVDMNVPAVTPEPVYTVALSAMAALLLLARACWRRKKNSQREVLTAA